MYTPQAMCLSGRGKGLWKSTLQGERGQRAKGWSGCHKHRGYDTDIEVLG